MKPIIIALVGASGSGKTTLSLHLQEHNGIPAVCSYTTRPMREGEINGRDHWFVGSDFKIPENPLAYTFFGGHHYWTAPAQINSKITSYVIDEKGLIELKSKWGHKYEILSVYIERPNLNGIAEDRIHRDLERVSIDLDLYDIVLHNDSDLTSFLSTAVSTIASYIY